MRIYNDTMAYFVLECGIKNPTKFNMNPKSDVYIPDNIKQIKIRSG
jgi:hypothetical protein